MIQLEQAQGRTEPLLFSFEAVPGGLSEAAFKTVFCSLRSRVFERLIRVANGELPQGLVGAILPRSLVDGGGFSLSGLRPSGKSLVTPCSLTRPYENPLRSLRPPPITGSGTAPRTTHILPARIIYPYLRVQGGSW